MTRPGTADNPVRVAIVGSGPAGFYAAGHLLTAQGPRRVEVDLFDRLPTPWGLVRAGVAPDHPKIKAVTPVYEKTAANPGFRFFGNVEFGRDITHADLTRALPRGDLRRRRPDRPAHGHPRRGPARRHAATEFVGWYNGHPDHRDLEFDLSARRAVVVGNGNVAIDVARILPLTARRARQDRHRRPRARGAAPAQVEEVVVLGRRGPAQAAFTNPELLELAELTDADVIVDPADLELDEHSVARSRARARSTPPPQRRDPDRLRAARARGQAASDHAALPRLTGRLRGDGQGRGDRVVRNELDRDADGSLRAAADRASTRRSSAASCSRSIGYRGVPLPGVPFDERRARSRTRAGASSTARAARSSAGEYMAGWIKRGPSGVIGTNKKDAQETVDFVIEDLTRGTCPAERPEPRVARVAHRRAQARRRRPTPAGRRSTPRERAPASRTAARG